MYCLLLKRKPILEVRQGISTWERDSVYERLPIPVT